MASPQAGLPDELAGHQVLRGVPSPILPNGPGYPRIVQAWLWLKKRRGSSTAAHLEPLVGPHSVLVLDGPEHLRQRKLILPAFHGDRMRAWEAAVRDITRAEIARWPVGKPFALRPSMQSITLDVIVRVVFGVETSA